MEKMFQQRIGYNGDIENISHTICKDFKLGSFLENKVIAMGYEDFNMMLKTSKGKYLVKILADFRNMKDCKRYTNVLTKAIENGVSTPKLLKSSQGYLHVIKIGKIRLRLYVMDFIEGRNFYNPELELSEKEIRFVSHQAALINTIKIRPSHFYDSWAIKNILKVFKERQKALEYEDLKMIKPVLKEFKEINIENLPKCFVHGDILKTNLLKDNNGKIQIIDFSVSNYYPRVVEMAVLACNVLFNKNSKKESERNLKIALEEYQKTVHLTEQELKALPVCIKASHAMHIICPLYERKISKNTTKENDYWLDQGRSGLRQML